MLHKFNTLVRLCIVAFLVIPFPVWAEDVPGEVTVNEGFDDSTYETGLTISGGSSAAYIYCNEQDTYGTSGCSLAITSGTYVFEFSEDVYEVGFIVGAVNNSYDVKYYYSDNTDETIQKSGQDNSDFSTMYDSFYKSFTDYNNDEANTDKFITKFEVTLSDISVLDTLYWQYVDESTIPTTTTSTTTTTTTSTTTTTTTSTTTTTTTTTTIPPTEEELNYAETGIYETNEERKAREEREAEEARVYAAQEWERDKNYEETGIRELDSERREREAAEKEEQETAIRDEERKANEEKWDCYMTNIQLERGDCDNYNASLVQEEVVEEKEEEVIIEEDEKEQPDTKEVISDDDVVVPEVVVDDEDKEPIEQPKEEVIEDELDQEIPGDDDIREEGVQEENVKDEDNKEEEIKEEEEVEETEENILEPEEEPEELEQKPVQDPVELTKEEIAVEVAEVEDIVEDIKEVEVKELETEQVIKVLTEVADVGVENLTEVSEDVLEVVSEVIEEVITIATEEVLTKEQVEVVQEVLNLEEPEDVQIIAEAVKEDEAVAEAVEEYVERAVENADVEDYNLADVVTEIQTEQFLADPVGAFTDIDIAAIDLTQLGDTMTSTQKEKAQEVVVPVIIASQIVASVQVVPVRIRRRI